MIVSIYHNDSVATHVLGHVIKSYKLMVPVTKSVLKKLSTSWSYNIYMDIYIYICIHTHTYIYIYIYIFENMRFMDHLYVMYPKP